MKRLVRGIGALLVLVALVVGAPLALLVWMGNPWPPGGWSEGTVALRVDIIAVQEIFRLVVAPSAQTAGLSD